MSRALTLAFWLALTLAWRPADSAPVYDLEQALQEFHDLSLLHKPANPPRRFGQLSSYDRNQNNYDQGNFLRIEPGPEKVLMDVKGPGVLTRLWTAEPMGTLRFYWDGARKPQLEVRWTDLQSEQVIPLASPFVTSAGGGCTMRFPLPFSKGLKVTLSDQTWCHWQIHYQYFSPGTPVESWWPALGPGAGDQGRAVMEAYTAAALAWENPGDLEPGKELQRDFAQLTALTSESVFQPEQDSIITELQVIQGVQEPLPEGLVIEIEQDGEIIRMPWGALSGVWDTTPDSPGLHWGREGLRSWMRIPFFLKAEERITFRWAGEKEGEFVGEFAIRGISAEEGPRLLAMMHQQQIGQGTSLRPPELIGNGRLLAIGTRVHSPDIPLFMEGDELIRLDGEAEPSIRGTGMEDIFDSAWYFMNREFSTAMAAAPLVGEGWKNVAARGAWNPFGIPFAKSLNFELEGGAVNDAPPTTHTLTLLGQRLGPPVMEASAPRVPNSSLDPSEFGQRITLPIEQTALPAYREIIPPVSLEVRPFDAWADPDTTTTGTATLEIREKLHYFAMHLDLPIGWEGKLIHEESEERVFDIGWPWIERWGPEPGIYEFTWSATAPAELRTGPTVVQLRARTNLTEQTPYTIAHPVKLYSTTGNIGQTAVRWDREEITLDGLEFRLSFPEDFIGQQGDMLVVDGTIDRPSGHQQAHAKIRFPPGPHQNLTGQINELLGQFPENGHGIARILMTGKPHRMVFKVGRLPSWIGPQTHADISIAETPDATWEITGARLLRRPQYSHPSSRRIPYRETKPGHFEPPEMLFLLEGEDLKQSISYDVATPQDRILMEQRRAPFLENAEAAPVGFALASAPHRPRRNEGAHGVLFPARRIGERIAINAPPLRGATKVGIQFGYGPWCGVAAVRDSQGRVAGIHELYFRDQVTFPQYLEVNFVQPNRDPTIYIEAYAQSDGGLEARIPIYKVMVLE